MIVKANFPKMKTMSAEIKMHIFKYKFEYKIKAILFAVFQTANRIV